MLSPSSSRKDNRPVSPWRPLPLMLAGRSKSFETEVTAAATTSMMETTSDHSSDNHEKERHHRRGRQRQPSRRESRSSSGSGSSWASWLLTSPSRLVVGNPLQRSSFSSPKRRDTKKRPLISSIRSSNLTMFLLRIDEQMPRYCNLLCDPSLADCQEAATILDSSMIANLPSSSPASSSNASTPTPGGTSSISTTTATTSLFRPPQSLSPKRTSASTLLILEAEWETHVAPLLLLTGAEALYGQMEVVHHQQQLINVTQLCRTIQRDLHIVKERLCDPWLRAASSSNGEDEHDVVGGRSQSAAPTTVGPTRTVAYQAAKRMARALESLQSFLTIRCQLVDVQTRLFSQSSNQPFAAKAAMLLETLRGILKTKDDNDDDVTANHGDDAVAPMLASVWKEVKAWIALLDTATHLEQCQFTDTILSARKLKQTINSSSRCVLQLWFRSMLDRFQSIMPIYFDRITAFASPLYGFDTMHLSAAANDHSHVQQQTVEHNYDSLVLDFLRKHEGKGGPSMAVCIVIDALSTRNLNYERGFVAKRVREEQSSVAKRALLTPAEVERKKWQAVYMRSSVHHNASASSPLSRSPSHGRESSISNIMRRSSNRSSSFRKKPIATNNEDDFSRSLASLVRNVSQDNSATSAQLHPSHNVLEYPPETGSVSWPYTEWPLLVDLIKNEFPSSSSHMDDDLNSVQAVTYRQPEPKEQTAASSSINRQGMSLAALGHAPPLIPSPPAKPTTNSSFHLVRLSNYITMVAIVKCEDDGKWHLRRTRGHSDEEIRVFLNEMAIKLRVSILIDSVETVKQTVKSMDAQEEPCTEHQLVDVWQHWDEANAQGFLRELKKTFQLRPQSPYMESLHGLVTLGNRVNRKKKRTVTHSESAAAFFLGPDLLQLKRPRGET